MVFEDSASSVVDSGSTYVSLKPGQAKTVTVRTRGGQTIVESYDQLVLATGSSPVTIPLPGSDDPRVMRLWTIPDMDAILARVKGGAKRAIVVGAGFIGLETA